MKLGMRVFDKLGYESTVYSKGTDMEEAPRKVVGDGGSWFGWKDTVTDGWVLPFCCSFEDIDH